MEQKLVTKSDHLNVWILDYNLAEIITFNIIQCLKQEQSLCVHIIASPTKNFNRIRCSRFIKSYHFLPEDQEQWVSHIINTIPKDGTNILLPVHENEAEFLIKNHDKLSQHVKITKLSSIESFKIATSKGKLAGFMQENDILHPPTIKLSDFNPDKEINGDSFLLKPPSEDSGRGIRTFSTKDEFEQHKNNITNIDGYIIQRFVGDATVCCSAFCKDGDILSYTIDQGFIAGRESFSPPTATRFIENDDVLQATKQLLKKLNWNGICNVDTRYDSASGKVFILEINARYWSVLTAMLMAGVNFPMAACYSALDKTYKQHEKKYFCYSNLKDYIRYRVIFWKRDDDKKLLKLSNTNISFILRDPLPRILSLISKIYKTMKRKMGINRYAR